MSRYICPKCGQYHWGYEPCPKRAKTSSWGILGFLVVLLVVLPGCSGMAGVLKELRQDPTVLVFTGFMLELGITPSATAGGIPLPNLRLGYGTLTRVGVHDKISLTVGASGEIKGAEGAATATGGGIPSLSGMSSLHLEVDNHLKAGETR